jgi:Zn-dependent protease
MNGLDLTVSLVVMRLIAGIIIAMTHGLALAAAAYYLGDKGPYYDGRLKLHWEHLDLLGLGSLMLTGFGWGQPIAIDKDQLKIGTHKLGAFGLILIPLAGSLALLLTGFVILLLAGPLLTTLEFTTAVAAAAAVRLTARLCVWMALFSLIPFPPLAGAYFLKALGLNLPRPIETFGGWVLLFISVFGISQLILMPAYNVIAPLLLGMDAAY